MKRLLLTAVLFLLSEISFAKQKLNYTVTYDSQIENVKGNFVASSNQMTYNKDVRTLKLVVNIVVENLESEEGLSIKESYGDEFTIFTDEGAGQIVAKIN